MPLPGGPSVSSSGAGDAPSSWLVENADLLPRGGLALDVACGAGRDTLWLAKAGFRVRAIDRDGAKIEALRALADLLGLQVGAEVMDLEARARGDGGKEADLGAEAYDLVLVMHYLHRPLFPALVRAVRPGGLLVYETFIVEQAKRGRPTNADFLLHRGELRRLVQPLQVLREREGEHQGRMVSGVVARRTAAPSAAAPSG